MDDHTCLINYEMGTVCERCPKCFTILMNATCTSAQRLGVSLAKQIILNSKERVKVGNNYLRVHNDNYQVLISIFPAVSDLDGVDSQPRQDVRFFTTSPRQLQWRRQAFAQCRLSCTDIPFRRSAKQSIQPFKSETSDSPGPLGAQYSPVLLISS